MRSPNDDAIPRVSAPGIQSQGGQDSPALPSLADDSTEGEETKPLSDDRHRAVSALLTDLAKTARAFILYDPRNDAIRQFLTSLLASFSTTLATLGSLRLQVQPFEFSFEGEVVYLNRDRERSLAFRLYRDGVRYLTIQAGFDWSELLQLLQILSIRYTGVHQYEDDAVTLLWKANFGHLDVIAVEGVTSGEDDMSDDDPAIVDGDVSDQAPNRGVALPEELFAMVDAVPPFFPKYEAAGWVEVPQERLELLRAETSDHALPASCYTLLDHILRLLVDQDAAWRFSEISHVFAEIRDFFLAGEQLPHFERLIDILDTLVAETAPPWDPWRQDAAKQILQGCRDKRAIKRLLHTTAVANRVVPPELIRLVDRLCDDPLEVVLETFVEERSTAARAFARQLLEHFGRDRAEELRERFKDLTGTMACDLLRAIAHIDLDNSATFIAQQCWHPDPGIQDEALRHLESIPYSGALGRHLFEAVCRLDPVRRIRVFKLILRSKDTRFVERMSRHVEQQGDAMSRADAEEFGRVMGRLGGESYLPLWRSWLTPAGWMRKTLQGPISRQVAAAGALGEIGGEEAGEILQDAAECAKGTPAQEWIDRAIGRREAPTRRSRT